MCTATSAGLGTHYHLKYLLGITWFELCVMKTTCLVFNPSCDVAWAVNPWMLHPTSSLVETGISLWASEAQGCLLLMKATLCWASVKGGSCSYGNYSACLIGQDYCLWVNGFILKKMRGSPDTWTGGIMGILVPLNACTRLAVLKHLGLDL